MKQNTAILGQHIISRFVSDYPIHSGFRQAEIVVIDKCEKLIAKKIYQFSLTLSLLTRLYYRQPINSQFQSGWVMNYTLSTFTVTHPFPKDV